MHPIVAALRRTPLPRLMWFGRQLWLGTLRPFRLGVRMMVLDAQGGVLLVRHSYRPGWHFPGGAVSRWETLEAAAIREAHEEAGIVVEATEPLFGVYANFGIGYCDHVALYVTRRWHQVDSASFEIVEARFFPLDALPADASPPTHRRIAEFLGREPLAAHW